MRWIVVCAVLAGGCAQGRARSTSSRAGSACPTRMPAGRWSAGSTASPCRVRSSRTRGDRGLRAVQGGQGDEARRRHALPRRARRGGDRRADPAGRTVAALERITSSTSACSRSSRRGRYRPAPCRSTRSCSSTASASPTPERALYSVSPIGSRLAARRARTASSTNRPRKRAAGVRPRTAPGGRARRVRRLFRAAGRTAPSARPASGRPLAQAQPHQQGLVDGFGGAG